MPQPPTKRSAAQPRSASARPLPPPVQPPREQTEPSIHRLVKDLPKPSAATVSARAKNKKPEAPSQQQFDRALLGGLRQGFRFFRWRLPQFSFSFWRAIPGRRLLPYAAALAALFFIAPYTPLSRWSKQAMDSFANDMKARAAFQVIDDFTSGVSGNWDSEGLVSDDSGAARVTGFTLNRNTMGLAGYRLDFDIKIASRGMGWVVGAADEKNYYAFKLESVGNPRDQNYRLVRYLVSEGETGSDRVQVDVPVTLNGEEFNRISVRLRENRIATFINGTGVDYWQAENPPQGGVGFFTEGAETAFVRRVEVSGNDDTWGLFLFGFLELLEDAKDFVEPVTARFRNMPAAESNNGIQVEAPNLAGAM